MCDHGDTVTIRVYRPAMSATDTDGSIVTWPAKWYDAPIDRCIAPIVDALVTAGICTIDSCCGHGKGPGDIILADGRVLMIHPDKGCLIPAPRADDGGAAFAEKVDALIAAVGGEYPSDRETAARARVLALHAEALARAERAEAALRDDVAAQYRATFAADAAARARLADERAGIPPTERDRRGVDLGVGRDL